MGVKAVKQFGRWLEVEYDDGERGRFFGPWLRDNATSGRHQAEGQRTFDINLMPAVEINSASPTRVGLRVTFGPDVHTETFSEAWLRGAHTAGPSRPHPVRWGSEQQTELTFRDCGRLVEDPAERRAWLVDIRDLGFGLVENVPTEPGALLDVVGLFGYVRETNYGQLFDVRVEPDPANLAFTSERIGMHTDNPYRDPVPGLQLLHCLVNETDGGANRLCDGFAVAEWIRREHPEAFSLLASQHVRFRFLDSGSADLDASVPLIELDARCNIVAVRYNSRSIQPFDLPPDLLADFYDAYRTFGTALHDPARIIEFTLHAGQMMVFDNQRILHGRTAYTIGRRHLQGCYADKDSLRSQIRTLEAAQ